mgnify:CR=1 FL=1
MAKKIFGLFCPLDGWYGLGMKKDRIRLSFHARVLRNVMRTGSRNQRDIFAAIGDAGRDEIRSAADDLASAGLIEINIDKYTRNVRYRLIGKMRKTETRQKYRNFEALNKIAAKAVALSAVSE